MDAYENLPIFFDGPADDSFVQDPPDFWREASDIRRRLKGDGVLIDRYLALISQALCFVTPSQVALDGGACALELCALCSSAIKSGAAKPPDFGGASPGASFTQGEGARTQSRAWERLRGDPAFSFYLAVLARKYLSFILPGKTKHYDSLLHEAVSLTYLQALETKISVLLESELPMKKLKHYIRRHYLSVNLMDLFIQAYMTEILRQLCIEDTPQGREVLVLLFEQHG